MRRLGQPGSPQSVLFGGVEVQWGLADDNDAIVVDLIIIISLKSHATELLAQGAGHMKGLAGSFFYLFVFEEE